MLLLHNYSYGCVGIPIKKHALLQVYSSEVAVSCASENIAR